MNLSIRRAAPAEVVDLRWAVLRPGRPRETAIFLGDESASHWVAEVDGRVVGVATAVETTWPDPGLDPPIPRVQLRGMAVDGALRGRGIGEALLTRVQVEVGAPMWCNARANVVGFYTRFGWEGRSGEFDVPGVGPHVRMTWRPRLTTF